ncbi:hypothetical protein BUALT_BualtUnG0054600 [Buddleja alternifolia]|uniref:SANTA domain-containing protein n=1 Tax=Buddleja alternifolia TaxID=168488 RepID=A0AAV6W0U4_9LAMI|nr:hypothetical protein BUALT_BualtUnG0054600 [Buddleja alternifolia]
MRVFSSAPILKRYDMFTLQTADGICVIIKGFINKARTVENGFPSDVFNHFVFGFPPYWKEYYENFMGGRNNWNFDFSASKGPIDKMKSRELDADSVQDEFDLISETPSLDKDLRKVKTKGNMQKAKIRATASLTTPAVADNQESINADKNSLSTNVKASVMKTRRKLAYVRKPFIDIFIAIIHL